LRYKGRIPRYLEVWMNADWSWFWWLVVVFLWSIIPISIFNRVELSMSPSRYGSVVLAVEKYVRCRSTWWYLYHSCRDSCRFSDIHKRYHVPFITSSALSTVGKRTHCWLVSPAAQQSQLHWSLH
jgi:hypothetical protein